MEQYYQKEMECALREDLQALQDERLRNTVRRVYDNVPVYRARMDAAGVKPEDIRSTADLRYLPFVTKQDLRDTYPYGMVACPMEDVVRIHATSGTTGKPVVACYTQNDLDMWAECCARALAAAGATRGDFVHVSYGYGLFTGGLGLHGGSQKLGSVTFPVATGNTARQIDIMRDMGSTILCCTPSYAAFLGETIARMGIPPEEIHLKAGIFGGEPWTEEMRRDIERSLHLRAHDIYGLTEVVGPGVAYECSQQHGLHINEDDFLPEIIDPETGEPLPDGERGELVFTAIRKEAFPLLRYRTRDICVLDHSPCACGRTFVRMTKPMGRTDDMLIIRGVNVFPSQIETVLLNMGYSANYQIVVDRVNNSDTLEVRVEMRPELFTDTVREIETQERRLMEALKSALGIAAHISLVAPGAIARTSGKAVRVVDHRKLI